MRIFPKSVLRTPLMIFWAMPWLNRNLEPAGDKLVAPNVN
jgi:hypothetical protein